MFRWWFAYGMVQVTPFNVAALAVFSLIVITYLVLAIHFPIAYMWATYEDLFGEWAQVYSFLIAAILLAILVARSRDYRWFCALLALACFYVVLEEISWGQRLLGFDTPEVFEKHNLQGETNLHNFFTGPYSTVLKDVIRYILASALIVYGWLYPFALRKQWTIAIRLHSFGLMPVPLSLSLFFIAAAFFELKPIGFNEAEIAELLVGIALAITALHYLLKSSNESRVGQVAWLIVVIQSIIIGSALTTAAVYADDSRRRSIDNRLERGTNKFAYRYRKIGQWSTAADLYYRLLENDPDSTYLLRRLAECYRQMGQPDKFHRLTKQALANDTARHERNPRSTSALRNMVRDYRLIGDTENSTLYLNKALSIGEERLTRRPDSAAAAYSYAKTLALADRPAEALAQFEQAHLLSPNSAKYRKAYRKALYARKPNGE